MIDQNLLRKSFDIDACENGGNAILNDAFLHHYQGLSYIQPWPYSPWIFVMKSRSKIYSKWLGLYLTASKCTEFEWWCLVCDGKYWSLPCNHPDIYAFYLFIKVMFYHFRWWWYRLLYYLQTEPFHLWHSILFVSQYLDIALAVFAVGCYTKTIVVIISSSHSSKSQIYLPELCLLFTQNWSVYHS